MTISELNSYIKNYIENDKTQTAIMLSGKWGTGKSHYIKNSLVPFLKKDGKDSCVVISLYGLEELTDVSKSIYIELRMRSAVKKSESHVAGKLIAKNVVKTITGKIGFDFSISNDDLQELYRSIDLTGKLLVFEDLERSNIEITKLLGYVNSLVEQDGVKVLLVANEEELLSEESDTSKVLSKTQYYRIKEKTVSDTIQFDLPLNDAVENIMQQFNNTKIKMIVEFCTVDKIVALVQMVCKRNLRTFIYAIQKTVDLINQIPSNVEYNDDFYECLFCGIIYFSSKIKSGEIPPWDGTEYLSTKLGAKDMPLMRFAYRYIIYKKFDFEEIVPTYEELKKYRFCEEYSNRNDEDLRVLGNFSRETEENVRKALINLESKLQDPNEIGIYSYSKLAYYMTYVSDIVDFDSQNACKLMLNNIKNSDKIDIDSGTIFLGRYEIEEGDVKDKYEKLILLLSEAIDSNRNNLAFSYDPMDLHKLYEDVSKNPQKYVREQKFISKYDVTRMVDMLRKSTSNQMVIFRGILFAVYREAKKHDFREEDVITLNNLFQMVKQAKQEENSWDKIQRLQINYLLSNLRDFIQQMS